MSQNSLPDIQRTRDVRGVAINKVGVSNIQLPIAVLRRPKDGSKPDVLHTTGTLALFVNLPEDVKGTHMSRFTQVLMDHLQGGSTFSATDLKKIGRELLTRLDAEVAFVELVVNYFVDQAAPVSGLPGIAPLSGKLVLEIHRGMEEGDEDPVYMETTIVAQGKTCCPCSREISDFDAVTGKGKGAHAQRSNAMITVFHGGESFIWFEDLLDIARKAFSSPIYPVLKRPDERHVTVTAYENPKFVEDVVRDLVVGLRSMENVHHYQARVVNEESIHYHNAEAVVFG